MISLEKGRLKGPCSLLEMVSTRGYSLLLLGLVDIPVRNVYRDSNGKGELYKPFVVYAGPISGVYLRVPKPFTSWITSTLLDALLPLPLAFCCFETRTCDAPRSTYAMCLHIVTESRGHAVCYWGVVGEPVHHNDPLP